MEENQNQGVIQVDDGQHRGVEQPAGDGQVADDARVENPPRVIPPCLFHTPYA